MQTNGTCHHCGKKIRFWISLCKECKETKSNSTAIISQNKTKLKKLLENRSFTIERFEKFILYTNNIIHYWKILMEFKENETIKSFDKIKKITLIILLAILVLI